jgi:hypothetical protein
MADGDGFPLHFTCRASSSCLTMTKHAAINDVFDRILAKYGEEMHPAEIPREHRTVVLAYRSHEIIGNGGFQSLFSADLKGDPEFLLTRAAFQTIGAQGATLAFERALAAFPNATPPDDIERRMNIWQSKYPRPASLLNDASPDAMYFSAMDETFDCLVRYVQLNASAFAPLAQ